jgi:hypothetical protein
MLRIFHKLLRALRRNLFLAHTDNAPFLSGDSFAKITDYHAYGRTKNSKLDLVKVKGARSLFIPGDKFRQFIDENYSHINARVLIVGNSDENFDYPISLPSSVSLCLIQNSTISDGEKIFTLPIGLENRRLGRAGNPNLYKLDSNANLITKVFVPPMSPTNPIRKEVLSKILATSSDCFEIDSNYVEIRRYIESVLRYKFILCLEGNGYENHRIWEALYLGVYPVVLETPWSKSLDYLGLPILFIRDIGEITEQRLTEFSRAHSNFRPSEMECLWIPFWEKWIYSQY